MSSQGSGVNGVDPELQRVRRESRNCETCYGGGMTVVFHPGWSGCRVGPVFSGEIEQVEAEDGTTEYRHVNRTTALEVAAHCHCAYGQWMRMRVDDDTRSRMPDVGAIVEGRSKWLLEPPGTSQGVHGEHLGSRKVESIVRNLKSRLDVFTAA